MAAIAAVFIVILHVSTFGRRVFLVGGNRGLWASMSIV
jgi:ribose/xylose/arabinose/galactoside ABC-type transport system permease subunit